MGIRSHKHGHVHGCRVHVWSNVPDRTIAGIAGGRAPFGTHNLGAHAGCGGPSPGQSRATPFSAHSSSEHMPECGSFGLQVNRAKLFNLERG